VGAEGIRFHVTGGFVLARQSKPKGKPQTDWPANAVQRWPIDRIKPFEHNARVHGPKQVKQLRASLREFGWTIPILVREDGTVIAGHGRLLAAQAEKIAEVPVIVAAGWTEDQCRAYTLADNQIALNSEWDDDALNRELALLDDVGVDLSAFGFDLTSEAEAEAAKAAKNKANAAPQLGDLSYSIVIRCGDEAHQAELLERLEREGLTCQALIS
jgi:ParB-like chromosome segregation protein Spo0J